jgi:hypothetical protein
MSCQSDKLAAPLNFVDVPLLKKVETDAQRWGEAVAGSKLAGGDETSLTGRSPRVRDFRAVVLVSEIQPGT